MFIGSMQIRSSKVGDESPICMYSWRRCEVASDSTCPVTSLLMTAGQMQKFFHKKGNAKRIYSLEGTKNERPKKMSGKNIT